MSHSFRMILAVILEVSLLYCLLNGVLSKEISIWNSCSQFFQYSSEAENLVGNFMLPIRNNESKVTFHTEWTAEKTMDFEKIIQNFNPKTLKTVNDATFNFKVHFLQHHEIPQLLSISINNETICKSKSLNPSALSYARHYLSGTIEERQLNFDQKSVARKRRETDDNDEFAGNPFIQSFIRTKTTTEAPDWFLEFQQRFKPTAAENAWTSKQNIERVCGHRTSSFTTFVNHGTEITSGQVPWLVAVMVKVPGGLHFLCGGSLVSARTVITAAHCMQSRLTKDDVVLHIGKHHLNRYDEHLQTREPQSILIHTDYNSQSPTDADLAIMHFGEPVRFTATISPICLWTGADDVRLIVGQQGFVAGWGSDEHGNNFTETPKFVDAKIVGDTECLRDTAVIPQFVTSRVLCAGNLDNSGPCSGDSGGGLMLNRNGRWQLRGIVSGGSKVDGKCNLRSYVLYCDLAKHSDWIERNVLY